MVNIVVSTETSHSMVKYIHSFRAIYLVAHVLIKVSDKTNISTLILKVVWLVENLLFPIHIYECSNTCMK